MKKAPCCMMTTSTAATSVTRTTDGKAHPSTGKQRGFSVAKCSLPTLSLALLPKCPACFAAYLTLGTGVSISVTAASFLRTLLIGICVASLVWIFASVFRSTVMDRLRPDSRLH